MNKENNEKVLDLIFTSIISEGGDGDAVWLSKYTDLSDIITIIDEYDKKNNTGWEIQKKENYLLWGINQEYAIITNDKNFFKSQSNNINLKLNY